MSSPSPADVAVFERLPTEPNPPHDWPLDTLALPTRMRSWAERRGVTTLRQLAAFAPKALLEERNVGRLSIAETRAVIEAHLGAPWETLAAEITHDALPAEVVPHAPSGPPTDWDTLRAALPDAIRGVALDVLDLPPRVRGYAEREGLRTVGDLAARSSRELRHAPSVGRRSVELLFEQIAVLEKRMETRARLADMGLLPSWKVLLLEQETVPRMAVTLRAGLGGHAETLRCIGETLGVSRERIRQLESRVIEDLGRENLWLGAVRARVDAALPDGATPLSALAADPWWAGIAALPEALDYFGARVLGGEMHVVELDERAYLARCTQETLDEAWRSLRADAERVPVPAPLAVFEALREPLCQQIGGALAELLCERLRGLLHVETWAAEPRVTGVGDTQSAAMLAILRASPVPVHVEDLWARTGRRNPPDEVLVLGHGLVGLPQHFPDFEAWMDRLAPAATRVMEREAPERQWLGSELLEELREELDIPEWLTDWHLGSLLRRSEMARYLGRNRFALRELPEGRGRLLYHEELLRLLRERGAPMTREELTAELRRRTSVNDATLGLCLSRPQFLRCSAERVGLIERDLPGGAGALAEAIGHVAQVLEQRQLGLGTMQLWTELTRLGPAHAQWTPEMCLSVIRRDERFRLSQSGAVGLSTWESTRVPSRLALMRRRLDDGRVTVEAMQRQIEAYYGEAPDRAGICLLAYNCGARLRGEWIERSTDDKSASEGADAQEG